MPTDPQDSTGTYLVWCMGRPQLNRVHHSQAAAERDADTLSRAYPNHRFDVFQRISSHAIEAPYGQLRHGPQRPPGTMDL